jgi:hypothetical protein
LVGQENGIGVSGGRKRKSATKIPSQKNSMVKINSFFTAKTKKNVDKFYSSRKF